MKQVKFPYFRFPECRMQTTRHLKRLFVNDFHIKSGTDQRIPRKSDAFLDQRWMIFFGASLFEGVFFAPQARFFEGFSLQKTSFFAQKRRFLPPRRPKNVTFWKNVDFFHHIFGQKTCRYLVKKRRFFKHFLKSQKIFELVKKFLRQSTQLAELRRFRPLLRRRLEL